MAAASTGTPEQIEAEAGSAKLQLCVHNLAGEVLSNLSFSRGIGAGEALERIRKSVAPGQTKGSEFLVLIGSEVLTDSGLFLRDYMTGCDATAQLLWSNELKVFVTSADGSADAGFSVPATNRIRDVASLVEDARGLPRTLLRFSFEGTVLPPKTILARLKKQPLTLAMSVLDASGVVEVPAFYSKGEEPSVEAEYMIDTTTPRFVDVSGRICSITNGQHMMVRGCPCKVAEVQWPRAGKGNPRLRTYVRCRDLFSGRWREDLFEASTILQIPVMAHRKYQFVDIDTSDGHVSLLTSDGEIKEHVDLPSVTARKLGQSPTEEDQEIERNMSRCLACGDVLMVETVSAIGVEKIVRSFCEEG